MSYIYLLYTLLYIAIVIVAQPISIDLKNSLTTAIYTVNAKIGSKEQVFRLIFDTGSGLTVIPSTTCELCQRTGQRLFNITTSSSYEKISCSSPQCDKLSCNSKCKHTHLCESLKCCDGTDPSYCSFYVEYADGSSAEGGLSQDDISLIGSSEQSESIKVTFGLVFKQQGNWGYQDDGLIGWSYGSNRGYPTIVPTWFDTYIENNPSIPNVFSTCFGREQGVLSIGGIDSTLIDGDIHYIDNQDSYYYSIKVNTIKLGDHIVSSTSYSAIVDSGTSLMVLPNALFTSLKNMFLTQYSHLPLANGLILDGLYALSVAPSDAWPTIEFQIEGISLSIPPANYFVKFHYEGYDMWVFGITAMDFDFILLGDTFMSSFTIVHDCGQGTIGFAIPTSKCFYTEKGTIKTVDYQPEETDSVYFILLLIAILLFILLLTCCCLGCCLCSL